ncbi:acyl carrier protein [Streptomyces sp. QHH-9511]|nr:acyl carrier protein [Streptomyces sp. QHH-9511]
MPRPPLTATSPAPAAGGASTDPPITSHQSTSHEGAHVSTQEFTLDDLRRILLEGAGADEGVDLDGDILDVRFEALGYESLALLETGSRIEREYGIVLDEDLLTDADTPRALIAAVNEHLAAVPRAA